MPDDADVRLELLGSVAGLAVAVAARREQDTPPVTAPSALRPYLHFTRLPPAAVGTVLNLLETDESLRLAVADALDGDGLPDRHDAVLAWLRRPRGWEAQWSDAVDTARAAREDRVERDRERRAERDRATAEESLQRATAELGAAQRELNELRDLRHALEAKVAGLVRELGQAEERSERAVEERARAVRELKDTERRLAERTTELRQLRAKAAEDPPAAPAPGVPVTDPRWAHVREVAGAIDALGRRLAELAREPATGEEGPRPDPPGATGRGPGRRPVRMGRGIPEGGVEEVLALLRIDGMVLLVDGYNVTMTGWPRLTVAEQRAALERLLEGIAATVEVHVVYDGEGEGASGHTRAGSAVRTTYTPTEREADDEIIDRVVEIDASRPVVVVSSDARVAAGARQGGANVVTSRVFLDAVAGGGRGR